MPRAKIICTLGPASDRPGVLVKMMRSGMDVVRLNFSHGSHRDHLRRIRMVRGMNKKYFRHIKIMGDLEGYRIRIGRLRGRRPVDIKKGQIVWFTPEDIMGEGTLIPFDYRGPLSQIKKGQHVYIDDGTIACVVEASGNKRLKARVMSPGSIKEHKGVNMPGVRIHTAGLTPKDETDIRFSMENGIEYIAQSFVRSREDILIIRDLLRTYPHRPRIIAKIENREGIENIDEIIESCHGIMVARGDLGISVPIYEVPLIQKTIIRKCNRAGKFVITATHMLESMTENPLPTRAEVSDVANAVLDGSDYMMLSAETAVGVSPPACVEMMNRIITYTEENA